MSDRKGIRKRKRNEKKINEEKGMTGMERLKGSKRTKTKCIEQQTNGGRENTGRGTKRNEGEQGGGNNREIHKDNMKKTGRAFGERKIY